MAQLNLYLPDKLKQDLEAKAKAKGMSLSGYVTQLIEEGLFPRQWPKGYFKKVLGGWQGELERPPQGREESRDWS